MLKQKCRESELAVNQEMKKDNNEKEASFNTRTIAKNDMACVALARYTLSALIGSFY